MKRETRAVACREAIGNWNRVRSPSVCLHRKIDFAIRFLLWIIEFARCGAFFSPFHQPSRIAQLLLDLQ